MKQKVGKRMMEIAPLYEKMILAVSILCAVVIFIIGFLFAMLKWNAGDAVIGLSILLVSLAVAIMIIYLGRWRAVIRPLQLYGMGVLVDKMEHLKPEYFMDEPPKTTQVNKEEQAQVDQQEEIVIEWKCPFCDEINRQETDYCEYCGIERIE